MSMKDKFVDSNELIDVISKTGNLNEETKNSLSTIVELAYLAGQRRQKELSEISN